MTDIIARVADALDGMQASGRTPARLLIGNQEAADLEIALSRPAKMWRGLFGEVIAEDAEYVPTLPLDMGPATLFGVPIERVDQPMLLGVIGEGED